MRLLLPLALALAVALALTVVACDGNDGDDEPTPVPTETASGAGATPTPTPTPLQPEEVCAPNPDPATPDFQVLDAPSPNTSVASPVTVSGQVLSFENNYQVAIYDIDGNVIVQTFGTAEGIEIGQLAPFSIDVPFEVEEPTPACIWVFEESAMSGDAVHVGQIPVLLLP